MSRPRYIYIDRTKGLAILLVVIGHLVAREVPAGDPVWYDILKERIYTFHMPLFMAVSGLVYGLIWQPAATPGLDLRDGWRRALRLMPSYLLFGVLIFFGKLTAQALFGHVDNPVHDWTDLSKLVFEPTASFTTYLWYIYALAILYLTFPLAFRLARGYLLVLLVVTLLFWLLPKNYWLSWDRLREFSAFFVIGVAAGRHHELTMRILARSWWVALTAFAVVLAWATHDEPALEWTAAALSLIAVPGLLMATLSWPLGLLETLGRYTLIIYLTNTIFIGLIKVAASRFGLWDADVFPAIALLMTVVATGVPILLKRRVLPWVPPLDRITT